MLAPNLKLEPNKNHKISVVPQKQKGQTHFFNRIPKCANKKKNYPQKRSPRRSENSRLRNFLHLRIRLSIERGEEDDELDGADNDGSDGEFLGRVGARAVAHEEHWEGGSDANDKLRHLGGRDDRFDRQAEAERRRSVVAVHDGVDGGIEADEDEVGARVRQRQPVCAKNRRGLWRVRRGTKRQ